MLRLDPPAPAAQSLAAQGLALLSASELICELGLPARWPQAFAQLLPSWDRLPPDAHLRDGGSYRRRRHSCYVHALGTGAIALQPHRAHWQPTDYNALHGGFERWFDPLEAEIAQAPAWLQLIQGLGRLFGQVRPVPRWFVEAHAFRIDTAGGVGRPTPEGAHRDGVDFVVVMLLGRHGVKGGESRVFEAQGPHGLRFEMNEPLSTLLLDDERVIHETTPIQPQGAALGHRDTLVLTFRAAGFQAPACGTQRAS
jgi:hypothetical protein